MNGTTTVYFFSYAGVDRAQASKVVEHLKAAQVDVRWDLDYIHWGDNWQDRLQEELSRCQGYIILVGESGIWRWVKAELQYALRRHYEQGIAVCPLLLPPAKAVDLPPFLSLFQAHCLADPLTDTNWAALADELHDIVDNGAGELEPDWDVEPFRGLEAYDEDNAQFFCGRQLETVEILARLGHKPPADYIRWLQVEGTSGVGKSSLLHAGLLPAVRSGWIEEQAANRRDRWTIARLRPGNDPLMGLRVGIGSALPEAKDDLRALSREDFDDSALLFALRAATCDGRNGKVLLVIDQFEELFTMTEQADRARFDASLANALSDPYTPLHLVTGIRSDFMPSFTELPRLRRILNERASRYYLAAIDETGLRAAVTLPAKRAGLTFSKGLTELIVEAGLEAGDAGLPLVANVLRLLWERARARGDRVMSVEDYTDINGVAGALASGADRAINGLDKPGREAARRLLLSLVHPGRDSPDTRKRIPVKQALEMAGGGERAQQVLNRLSGLQGEGHSGPPGPRLVVVSGAGDHEEGAPGTTPGTTVELAHELLLREHRGVPYWKTLKEWVDTHRVELRRRERLIERTAAWHEAGRPWRGGYLASGRALREFRSVELPGQVEGAYLRASRLWRWTNAGAVIGTVAVTALAVWLLADGDLRLRLGYRLGLATIAEPPMVTIRGGEFTMGASRDTDPQATHNESPTRTVKIASFKMARYEANFSEYFEFAKRTGRAIPDDEGWGQEGQPVINVSWEDAVAYAEWLSNITGKRYRLPSESEWEFSARGGGAGRFWWCDEVEPNCGPGEGMANCADCGSELDGRQPAPRRSFQPNPFGLYDTAGNVWEWVQDCWHENYQAAPTDGVAREEPQCAARVLRGGSFRDDSRGIRSAYRRPSDPASRGAILGFRLVEELQ